MFTKIAEFELSNYNKNGRRHYHFLKSLQYHGFFVYKVYDIQNNKITVYQKNIDKITK